MNALSQEERKKRKKEMARRDKGERNRKVWSVLYIAMEGR